jgi:hypothetical protein
MSRLLAHVHTNKSKTLSVIANLVKSRFSVDTWYGCLHNQFLYTVESLTGRPTWDTWIRTEPGNEGIAPLDLIKMYKRKLKEYSIEYIGYQDIDEALEDTLKGQPVVMVISSDNPMYDDSNSWYLEDRKHPGEIIYFSGDILNPPKNNGYHALLLIGYDSKNDFLIFRDSKDVHSYNGYFRVKKKLVKSNPESARFFSFSFRRK